MSDKEFIDHCSVRRPESMEHMERLMKLAGVTHYNRFPHDDTENLVSLAMYRLEIAALKETHEKFRASAHAEFKARAEAAEAWKSEQLAVESEWDVRAVAKALDLRPGTSIRRQILPGIEGLKARIADLEAELKEDHEASEFARLALEASHDAWVERCAVADKRIADLEAGGRKEWRGASHTYTSKWYRKLASAEAEAKKLHERGHFLVRIESHRVIETPIVETPWTEVGNAD